MSFTKFVVFGTIGNQDGCPGLIFAETFLSSSLKPLNRIQGILTGSKILTSSTNFVIFFSSENKIAVPASDWLIGSHI